MIPVSVILITKNEEENIRRCLNSVSWADEIVVVDSGSSDRTVEIARRYTHKVYVTDWHGFFKTKEYAISKTRNWWILWLDADEEVTEELRNSILNLTDDQLQANQAFAMNRRTYFMGRWIKHCGWSPEFVVRLFHKNWARFSRDSVHERLIVEGKIGHLSGDLLHYTDQNFKHYFKKFHHYTELAAQDLFVKGVTIRWWAVTLRALAAFFKIYFLKRGFLDGIQGFQIATLTSFYIFVKYFKLWELQRTHGSAHFRPGLRQSKTKECAGS